MHTLQGSKGASSTFKQTPDNLRSTDTFEGVLGLGIGPMKGPLNGLKSVYLNGTQIEDDSGTLNFEDFQVVFGDGDPAKFPQQITLKLGQGASPQNVGLTLTNEGPNLSVRPTAPGPWLVQTIHNVAPDFLDVRFIVEQLLRQDSKGVYDETLTLDIQLKPTGTVNWIDPTTTVPTSTYNEQGGTKADILRFLQPQQNYNPDGTWKAVGSGGYAVSGKTTSPSVYELRLAVPNTGAYASSTWDVRCRLVEADHFDDGNGNIEYRTVQWESISAVYAATMGTSAGWRGVTWMQLYGKASDQLTSVPAVTSEWATKIIAVPPSNVFNPDTRQYASGVTWDGSWALSYTNDPAWIINDVISDSLSGLSLIAEGSYLNKWDALEVSKWCSTLVPDGAGTGGLEPRYALNIAITEQQKAEDLIRYMAGAVGALAWDQGDGEWRMKIDKPETPVDIFTLESINGEFVYSHTDVDTRYNDVTMQFLNKEMLYRQDSVHLFDNASIALIGRKPTTVVAVGCTGRQEAMRRGMLRLRSSVNETKIVTFTTNRRGRNVEQLDTILVADGDLGDSGQRTTGRIIGISADRKTLTLRDPVYLAPGIPYTVNYAVPNPSYAPETTTMPTTDDWKKPTLVRTTNILNAGTQQIGPTRTLILDTALPTTIATNMSLGLSAVGLPTIPKLYRVTAVQIQDDGENIGLSAVEVDTGKWDASDNVTASSAVFTDLRGVVTPPLPPESPTPVLSLLTVPSDTGVITNLLAQWVRPTGAFISGFRVQYSLNGSVLQTGIERTQIPNFELVNPAPGQYHFEICTIDRRGAYSAPLKADLLVGSGPDQTKPAFGQLWKEGTAFDATHTYVKGDVVSNQGATWVYQSDSTFDGTPPPTLPASENLFWIQIKDATSSSISLDTLAVALNADYTGTVLTGQLPISGQASYIVGTADVSASTTWSIASTSGCTASIDTGGTWTLTAVTTTGYFDIEGIYNGMPPLVRRIPVTVTNGAPPSGGGSGMSAVITSFPAVSATTYPSAPSTTAIVGSGTAGKINFSGTLNYQIPVPGKNTNKNFTLIGKIVYRVSGGTTWTDAAAETNGVAAAATGYPEPESDPGQLTMSVALTGLTASTNYEFGILLRKAGSFASLTPSGAITGATGS